MTDSRWLGSGEPSPAVSGRCEILGNLPRSHLEWMESDVMGIYLVGGLEHLDYFWIIWMIFPIILGME